jgi:hypothetical protein
LLGFVGEPLVARQVKVAVEEIHSEHAGKVPGGFLEPRDGASVFFHPTDQLLRNVTSATTVLHRGGQLADPSCWDAWRLMGEWRAN